MTLNQLIKQGLLHARRFSAAYWCVRCHHSYQNTEATRSLCYKFLSSTGGVTFCDALKDSSEPESKSFGSASQNPCA